mmetsp:Transcript_29684/g.59669  ORF Transcript_29684/g.59669 Transcript_29684/m.59669 type:complete len:601 (+) Transcript_29684:139-1941(+)
MLDLIVFASAALITKRVCDGANREKQHLDPIQRAAHHLFQLCLFLSLLLFSLAILEAAPLSWMVLIYRSTILIYWYRIILWLICVLLLIIHPICLAFAIRQKAISTSSSGMSSSPSSSSLLAQVNSWSRVAIIVQLLWTVIRFFFVAIVWRFLLRKIIRMILPVDYDSTDDTENDVNNNNNRARGEGGMARQQNWKQHCSFSAIALSSILVCLTFVSLGAMRTLVTRTSNTEDEYTSTEATQQSSSLMKSMVTMICSFGLIVASILNGFGSSSLPHSNLVGIFLKPTPSTTLTKAENDCYYANSQLEEKECLLSDIMQSAANNGRSSSSSSFTSSLPTINAEKKKIQQLQDEVMFLSYLVNDMNDDIHEMKQSQHLALRARTIIGRIRVVFGVILSIVLVVRVVLASKSLSLLFQDQQETLQSPRDPVTSILLWLIGNNIVSEDQYNDLAQGTSLVLAGMLSTSQVRSFLRVINALGRKLNRMFGKSCGALHAGKAGHFAASSVANILASYVMGSYFLSCVVLVKMNLPVAYRASFSSAVGYHEETKDFDFNTVFLNVVFFAASVTSALILALLFGVQRNHSTRYQLESQLNAPLSGVSV